MTAKGLNYWVTKLTKHNMPVVGKVIAELNTLTGSEESDAAQLSEVILRDPNLTTHVLRVSNSAHYNYSKSPINTVSKSIILIGLKGVRAICISLLIIDSLLAKGSKERLLQLMAQGLHAATQARDLIKLTDEDAAEEVFIAALLFHLGEMAFLASEEITEKELGLLSTDSKVRKSTAEQVLGTTFKAITRSLTKYWSLGEVLEQALSPGKTPSSHVQAVILGERMSRAALKGWNSALVAKVTSEIADYTHLPPKQCLLMAQESAERAADVALQYGVADACILIPSKGGKVLVKEEVSTNRKVRKILKGDPQLQLNALRELTSATFEGADVSTILQIVIEGMHRGIGLERVAIAFLSDHTVKAKYVLGDETGMWKSTFDFDAGPYSDNIFTYSIESGGATWIDKSFLAKNKHLHSNEIISVIGEQQSFIYVLKVGDRVSALFYADRGDARVLSDNQFSSFCHFAEQTQLSLNMLSQKNASIHSFNINKQG